MTRSVGIYLFDEVEVLDFAGPFEVFSTAARVKERKQPDAPPVFELLTIADSIRLVRARAGLLVQPMFAIGQHAPLDVLIIPGGIVSAELERPEIIAWIRAAASTAALTASVCTGAFLLARAGLLSGKQATTHWEDLSDLQAMFPDVHVKSDTRWVDEGAIVTSAGISAGIDMSLHLVARLEGEELAHQTARQMQFDWHAAPAEWQVEPAVRRDLTAPALKTLQ
jgi:transcriptional regulator GlxA family with amidase domain